MFASLVTDANFPALKGVVLQDHVLADSTLAYVYRALGDDDEYVLHACDLMARYFGVLDLDSVLVVVAHHLTPGRVSAEGQCTCVHIVVAPSGVLRGRVDRSSLGACCRGEKVLSTGATEYARKSSWPGNRHLDF